MKKLLLLTIASYLLTNTITAQNLLTNGDFESGGSGNGFFVDGLGYTQLTGPFSGSTSAGNYAFVNSPQNLTFVSNSFIASSDHTTGTGLMMVVDGNNNGVGNPRFWKAGNAGGGVTGLTIGKKYEFSYWVRSIYDPTIVNSTRPNLGIQITNASSFTPALSPTLVALPNNPWQRISYTFIANATSVNIELWNQNTGFEGNDFAVDDFAVVEAVSLQYSFLGTTCAGFANNNGSITAYGMNGTPPYTFTLSGPSSQTNTTGVFTTLQVGTYNVTVTDSGLATATSSNIIIAAPTNINAGPDTTISLGSSTTLTAINGTGVYNWTASPADPSLTTPNNASISVTPTQPTTYTVSTGPTYLRNLVYNGDFSSTNLGFISEANYLNPTNPGNVNNTFGVVANSSTWSTVLSNCSAVGGTGKMLVYKGSNTAAVSTKVWKQIIPVVAGQNYDFSYLVQSLNYVANAAMIDVTINGVTINSTNAPTSNCSWQSRNFTWNSAAATTAEICIVDRVTAVGAQNNAFAIDNIKFETTTNCLFTDSVTVYILTATPSDNQLSVVASTSSTICLPGECTDFTAIYSDLEYTNDYTPESIPYQPYPYSGGTILPTTNSAGTNDDDFWSTTIVMPFSFNFYGNAYTNFILGTNGVISFTQNIPTQQPDGFCQWAINQNIPSPANPVNSIFVGYQDLHYAARPPEAYINYYSLGTAPNRVMVVNYYHIPQFPAQATNLQTYQVVLHETTNIIEINFERRIENAGWNGGNGIVGIQNATGTIAEVIHNALDPTWTANNESFQFVPSGTGPPLVSFHWESALNPGVVYSTANPMNECIEGAPETYIAVVEYTNSVNSAAPKIRITDSATAEVNPPLPVTDPIDICYNGSLPATINIDQTSNVLTATQVGNYLLTYFTVEVDAENGNPASQIPDELNAAITSLPLTVYVRIEDTSSSGCFEVRSFVITNAPSGTFSYDATYCNNLLVGQLPITTNLTTGGTFTATPISPTIPTSILIIDATTGAITPDGSDIGSYTVSYDIPATTTCLAFHYEFDVEILSCGCTVSAINSNGAICEGSSVDLDVTTPVPGGTYTWTGPDSYNSGPLASPLVTITPTSTGNLTYNLSVTSSTGNCTSSTLVVVNPLPAIPTITSVAPTCAANGTSTISNYNATYTYTFAPTGPTVSATGLISGMTIATNYTLTAALGTCTSNASTAFSNAAQLVTPVLTIANPSTVCSPATVDITSSAVIVGNTNGGTVTYWQDATATISLTNPTIINTNGTYYIKSSNGSCFDIESVIVTITSTPSLLVNDPQNVCFPTTVDLTLPAITSGSSNLGALTYWTNSTATIPLSSPNIVNSSGTYYIKSTSGICSDIKPVIVSINPLPVLNITNPNAVCFPDTVDLTDPSVTAGSDTGVLSYWTNSNLTTAVTTPSSVSQSGIYYIELTINGCSTVKSVIVIINPLPIIELPTDPFVCVDINGLPTTTVDLETGLNPANYSFEWYNDTVSTTAIVGTNSSYTAKDIGTYRVEVTNNTTTCINSASVEVISSLPPSSLQFITSSYFSNEEMVVVNVTPVGDYEYQIDNEEFQDSNQFVGLNSGEHTIVVRDKFSCGMTTGTVTLLDYPKFFTPNGDGFNDTWNISDLDSEQPNAKIYIFDRYGKLVKQIAPGINGWNGNFNGTPLPADDYWFTIEYQEQQINKIFKSHFALKR
jgi:gliding motility-associated-like protein